MQIAECCKSLKSSITSEWLDNTKMLTPREEVQLSMLLAKHHLPAWCLLIGFLHLNSAGTRWCLNGYLPEWRGKAHALQAVGRTRNSSGLFIWRGGEGRNLQNLFETLNEFFTMLLPRVRPSWYEDAATNLIWALTLNRISFIRTKVYRGLTCFQN